MRLSGSIFRLGAAFAGVAVLTVGCAAAAGPQTAAMAARGQAKQAAANAPASAPPTTDPSPPVIATATPAAPTSDLDTKGISVQINSAHRDSSGIVTLVWTLANQSDETFAPFRDLSDLDSKYSGESISQVNLIDQTQRVRYYPLIDDHNVCGCSTQGGNLKPGEKIAVQNMYKPDPSTKSVTVEIKGFKPISNVPIS